MLMMIITSGRPLQPRLGNLRDIEVTGGSLGM